MASIKNEAAHVIETVITDEDLQTAAEPKVRRTKEHPDKGLMEAFESAKNASDAQNERYKRIVQAQRSTHTFIDEIACAPERQTTLFDF